MNQSKKRNQNYVRNSIRGLQNRTAGKEFEEIIDTTCKVYEMYRLAKIEKTPEPVKIIQSLGNGRYIACFEKQAQPDYKGTLKGGASVVFEAKSTSGDQMKQEVVKDWQAESLDFHARLGARCFVCVSFAGGRYYRIPWGVWREMQRIYGHKYVTPDEIEQYRIPIKNGVPDFLGLITK